MSNRPPALCNLKTGKLIDTQNNFADTFNWLVSCVDNLKGGTGIKVEWTSTDTPEISLDQDYVGGAGDGGGTGGGGGETEVQFIGDVGSTDKADTFTITGTGNSVECDGTSITIQNQGVASVEGASQAVDGYYKLTVDNYVDGETEINVPVGVQMTGTDQTSTDKTNEFTFQSASDSNIVVQCDGNTITIGCYYI